MDTGSFVISLDLEKYWGMRDKKSITEYEQNLANVNLVTENTLLLFNKNNIRATWAVVGFLFFENFDQLRSFSPKKRPSYENYELNPYIYIDGLSIDQRSDLYHFAREPIRKIIGAQGQELGTHTFSHLYFLENGVSKEASMADLSAAIKLNKDLGLTTDSIIFPRNQYNDDTLELLKSVNIKVYRGNEHSWLYRPSRNDEQSKLRRALRLIDAALNISGHHTYKPKKEDGLINVPSSRFLRPITGIKAFDQMHMQRIKKSMTVAAKQKKVFHLWWHPHNFGKNIEHSFERLDVILNHYQWLHNKYGFASRNMGDFVSI